MVPLKYLGNYLRTLKIFLINCEINLILTMSKNGVISSNTAANQETVLSISDKKLYVQLQYYQLKIIHSYFQNLNQSSNA